MTSQIRDLRRPPPPLPRHRLDQHPRPRAGRGGRPRRHRRHRPRAERGARPPGPGLDGAGRQGAALLGDPATTRRAPPAAAALGPAGGLRRRRGAAPRRRVHGQVAQRRLARGAQAGGDPDRGQAAGRLGGDRRRPQPLDRARRVPPDLRQPATSLGGGVTPERARRELDRQLGVWACAEEEAILAEWRGRDALRGREISWEDGSGVADGIDDRGNLVVALADGSRVSLGAGEVRLRL